jgi:acetyl esterase
MRLSTSSPEAGPAATMEPDSAAFAAEVAAQPQPVTPPSIDTLRSGYRQAFRQTSVAPSANVTAMDLTIPGSAGSLPARLYTPNAAQDTVTGLLIYAHGGGFAVGDLESHDALLRLIAEVADVRVLTVDYRLAPEHKFPAARDDVLAVFGWASSEANALGIDPSRIALGGESAGATHAIAATLTLRDAGLARPAALWVMVPATDASASGPSHKLFATGAGRTAAEFQFLWGLYAPEAMPRDDPGLSPLFADLRSLPPTLIYTAEFDPARDDGEQFARRAREAGVNVRLWRQSGLIHQFPEITGRSKASERAVRQAAKDLSMQLRAGAMPSAG